MDRVQTEAWANPSSTHRAGKVARDILENARETVARILSVRPDEILFTSGGTESDNLALKGRFNAVSDTKDHAVTTLIEHPAVHEPLLHLEAQGLCSVTRLVPDRTGLIDIGRLESAITDRTAIVSIILANNELGTLQDIAAIGRICARHNVVLHTDAVQAVGKIPVEPSKHDIGLLSASAHKFNGPKGVGFLFKRRDIRLIPLLHGGGQEKGLRSGTEPVALVAGLAAALEMNYERMASETTHLRTLTDVFFRTVKAKIPTAELNGHPDRRLPNTLNIRFPGISGPKIVSCLDEDRISVSPSSACSSSSSKPSRILTAIGLMADEAFSSVRFSFGPEANESDIPRIVAALLRAVED
jgi:cysteine desulfurase